MPGTSVVMKDYEDAHRHDQHTTVADIALNSHRWTIPFYDPSSPLRLDDLLSFF